MSLDKRIERKKNQLNTAINTKGIMDNRTIKISQQLDVLIVQRIRRVLA
jgi:hypothetical protein